MIERFKAHSSSVIRRDALGELHGRLAELHDLVAEPRSARRKGRRCPMNRSSEGGLMRMTNKLVWKAISAGAAVALLSLAMVKAHAANPESLVFAAYDGEKSAKEAFKAMQESQAQGVIHIDSFAVV